jgi:hypothetical protein
MRRLGRILMVVVVVGVISGLAQGEYGGGTGEPNDPYLIYDANQMNAIGADANDWDKSFRLMADLDLSRFDGKDGRLEFNIIAPDANADEYHNFQGTSFTGVFDGNDHAIFNFTYDSNSTDYIGIFGCVGHWDSRGSGEIRNLKLVHPVIDAGTGGIVGSLVGWVQYGTITNCYAEKGSITGGSTVGGLVGVNYRATLTNCYAEGGSAMGDADIGGLVGVNECATITDCWSRGDVMGNSDVGGLVGLNQGGTLNNSHAEAGGVTGKAFVGGLVGWNNDHGTITNCYSAADVSGAVLVGGQMAGLVGRNTSATITNCYATGSVMGRGFILGGLVGNNERESLIANCYATGSVSGEGGVGGLVGNRVYGTITNSYWDTQTSGEPNMCGHEHPECDNSYGKTTTQMKQQSTFKNWDFINVWDIGENQTYPYLRTVPAGDINHDRIVNLFDFAIIADQWMNEQ